MSEFKCIRHVRSNLVEGGGMNITILEDVCLVCNALFSMRMKFTNSVSGSYSNLLLEKLPIIVYGDKVILKQEVYTFLKSISDIDNHLILPKENLIEQEILENKILIDLQLCIDTYNYFVSGKKSYFLWNFLKCIYQPFRYSKVFISDYYIYRQISRYLGITSKVEVIK
jgi:hypothetical protein